MANKRRFKKNVEELSQSICAQLLVIQSRNGEVPSDVTARNINRILNASKEAKNKSNHFLHDEGKKGMDMKERLASRKKFFKNLFDEIKVEYSKELDGALRDFNENLPESVKRSNKASL